MKVNPIGKEVKLVRRDEIPSMRTVVVDGVEHWLGHVKDFTKNDSLLDFLPSDNRVSMAWVRLEAGERLDEHTHPVDSMILMCEGGSSTLGDVETDMQAGDVLLVPQGRPHGFLGAKPNGFWGLSLQFDSRGLYEEISDPWAVFSPNDGMDAQAVENASEELLRRNELFVQRFDKHRLFALIDGGLLNSDDARERFLDCFQVWSEHFQKMVLTRTLTTQDAAFEDITWEHMFEELGHSRSLAGSRAENRQVFDPVLDATCAWFSSKIAQIGDLEKVVLVHLVVEASATSFYKHTQPIMQSRRESDHFEEHSHADARHVEIGIELIKTAMVNDARRLLEIQQQGWSMLTALMGRIADLVVHYSKAESDAA